MSRWKSVKARQLLAALLRIGWEIAWQRGSHRRLKRPGWPNYSFAFHDSEEIGRPFSRRSPKRPVYSQKICSCGEAARDLESNWLGGGGCTWLSHAQSVPLRHLMLFVVASHRLHGA